MSETPDPIGGPQWAVVENGVVTNVIVAQPEYVAGLQKARSSEEYVLLDSAGADWHVIVGEIDTQGPMAKSMRANLVMPHSRNGSRFVQVAESEAEIDVMREQPDDVAFDIQYRPMGSDADHAEFEKGLREALKDAEKAGKVHKGPKP